MYASGSEGMQSISGKKSTYGLLENEKVLSAIARWGTYANMKVSQAAFGDPLFVAMLQAARGPHETKGVVLLVQGADLEKIAETYLVDH